MSFLAPLYLALAGAAVVPLLVHLLRRRIGARLDFPAVRYLVRAEQERSRRSRLRNLLLLLLRIAAVLLIALAAARPMGRVGGAGHPPTALAIVLDNSLSTSAVAGGGRVLDDLRSAARDVAAAATTADRVWLVTADSAVTGTTPAAVRAAIDAARPLAGAGSPGAALARAAALVRAAALPGAHVVLLTDAQATSWETPPQVGEVGVTVYAPAARPPANAAVVEATPRPARWTPAGQLALRFAGAAPTASYRVQLGETTIARGSVPQPGADGSSETTLRATPAGRGWLAGTAALPPDELREDDTRHFAVWLGDAPRVAADTSAGTFARTAVAALVQSGRAAAGGEIAIAGADAAPRLPALLTAPVDPVRVGAANRALERLGVPWRFGAVRSGEQRVTGGGELAGAAGRVLTRRRYALVAQPGAAADTLASAGNEPWIVAGPNYVLVASPLVPEATTLPVQAAFVPWLGATLAERLAGAGARVVYAAPGAAYDLPEGLGAPGEAGPAASGSQRRAAPREPGVYWFTRAGGQAGERAGALVVNAEAQESLLERVSTQELGRRLRARRVNVAARDGLAASAFAAGGAGRPIGGSFLVAALVALAAETVVAGRLGRRAA